MLIVLFILISFVGSGLVHRAEVKIGTPQPPASLMGQWPHNMLLLVGVVLFLLINDRPYETTVKVVVIVATALFYVVRLYRLNKQ